MKTNCLKNAVNVGKSMIMSNRCFTFQNRNLCKIQISKLKRAQSARIVISIL